MNSRSSRRVAPPRYALLAPLFLLSFGAPMAGCEPDLVVSRDEIGNEAGEAGAPSEPGPSSPSDGGSNHDDPPVSAGSGAMNSTGATMGAGGTTGAGAMSNAGARAGSGANTGSGASTGSGGATAAPRLFVRRTLRLSEAGFERTLASLLGQALPPRELTAFPESLPVLHSGGLTCQLTASNLALANAAVDAASDTELLDALGCDSAELACAEGAALEFAARAWRRPLSEAEGEQLLGVYQMTADAEGPDAALRELVRHVLTSPEAACVRALGTPTDDDRFELDAFELASLLAYGVTGLPPDDVAWQAALDGELDPADELERLLETDAAREHLALEVRRWFNVPDADQLWIHASEPELADSMVEETRRLIEDVVFERPAPVSRLVDADYSFIDETLAQHYGLEAPDDDWAEVQLSETPRRGILHHASYLTATSTSVDSRLHRALGPFDLLCTPIPAAPPDSSSPDLGGDPEATRRERLGVMTGTSACAACHQLIDPMFFAFEHFDATGGYRELHEGKPIDTTGTVGWTIGDENVELEFADSTELVEEIAEMPRYTGCFVQRLVGLITSDDAGDGALERYAADVQSSGEPVEALDAFRAFVASEQFRYRRE